MGGEPMDRPGPRGNVAGLSPRGRGTRQQAVPRRVPEGSIPAWAGNPPRLRLTIPKYGVYPRVGGEPPNFTHAATGGMGLSPRGRGTPKLGSPARSIGGSIPAWAGNPRARLSWQSWLTVYPRVGGEPQHRAPRPLMSQGLSPRGRGTPIGQRFVVPCLGSIPAWAGNPSSPSSSSGTSSVYPRVGGEPRH